jgi:hypothetical protein
VVRARAASAVLARRAVQVRRKCGGFASASAFAAASATASGDADLPGRVGDRGYGDLPGSAAAATPATAANFRPAGPVNPALRRHGKNVVAKRETPPTTLSRRRFLLRAAAEHPMPVAHALRGKKSRPLMANRVPLDNVDHQHLRVIAGATSEQSVNQALVVPSEFEQLQREYPILFRKDSDGEFQAVAVLGLDRGENLFLSEGEWTTRYVPATLRRGPLFLGVGDQEQPGDATIVVDLEDPRISESDGEPLFLPQGGTAPFLRQAAEALHTVHEGLDLARAMFALFGELDLIRPVEISVEVGDGTRYRLPNFLTIDGERLAGLSGPELQKLSGARLLAPAIHVRSSLGNINRLIELKSLAGA